MARFELKEVDRIINQLTIFVLIGGGLMVHVLTALTINSYYGSPWGYLSFFLPGFSEIYLLAFQLNENMYHYKLILAGFSALSGVLAFTWLLKTFVRLKLKKPSISRPSNDLL